MQTLYEDFLKTQGDWKKGIIWKEVVQRRTGKARGVRKWMTKPQLVSHFDDEQAAESVIERKESTAELQDEVRDHPDLPGNVCRDMHTQAWSERERGRDQHILYIIYI